MLVVWLTWIILIWQHIFIFVSRSMLGVFLMCHLSVYTHLNLTKEQFFCAEISCMSRNILLLFKDNCILSLKHDINFMMLHFSLYNAFIGSTLNSSLFVFHLRIPLKSQNFADIKDDPNWCEHPPPLINCADLVGLDLSHDVLLMILINDPKVKVLTPSLCNFWWYAVI